MQRQNPNQQQQQQLQQQQQQQQVQQYSTQEYSHSSQEQHQQQRISRTEQHVQRSQITTQQRGQSVCFVCQNQQSELHPPTAHGAVWSGWGHRLRIPHSLRISASCHGQWHSHRGFRIATVPSRLKLNFH